MSATSIILLVIVLVAIVVVLGLYDFLGGYFGWVVDGADSEVPSLLLLRYTGFVPLLLLTRRSRRARQ